MPARTKRSRDPGPGLAEKVAALRRPQCYGEPVGRVEALETHQSWVFLTARHAYKLKKPVRLAYLDFSTLEARERDCREEVRLNRRLAAETYLGVVALTRDPDGDLRVGGQGAVVDWLVKMRRLASDLMLDRVILAGRADARVIGKIADLLSAFYGGLAPVVLSPSRYVARFEREIDEHRRELARADYGLPRELVRAVTGAQGDFLRERGALLRRRVDERRIVEGHGDLRPEHVYVGDPPEVIDCLEFRKAFRIVDPADELAFLWMECAGLGAPDVGEGLWRAYADRSGDDAPAPLLGFYRSHRACLRAKLSLWHLKDRDLRDPDKWRSRGASYLDLAGEAVGELAAAGGSRDQPSSSSTSDPPP